MLLKINFDAGINDLFVEATWQDAYGVHSQRLTEEMPPQIKKAAQDVIDWANAQEHAKVQANQRLSEIAEIDREISRLNQRKAAVNAR